MHNTHPTHGKTESELQKPRLKKKKKEKKKEETQRRQKPQTQAFELKQRIREAWTPPLTYQQFPCFLMQFVFWLLIELKKSSMGKKWRGQ